MKPILTVTIAALLFALLALVFLPKAYAADFNEAYFKSEAGGDIVMTQDKCPFDSSPYRLLAYAHIQGIDNVTIGCWDLKGDKITVFWDSPRGPIMRVYTLDGMQFR
jgi:hypothetical protein